MEWLRRGALVALSLAAVSFAALAQDYPTRPLTIVVPFTPGAATEFLARLLGKELEERLGKPVVVENRPAPAPPSARTRSPRPRPTATRC